MSVSRKPFWVYLMASRSRTLYVGVTSDLERRVYEHKNKLVAGFTSKYNIHRLIHFEEYANSQDALAREKQIKSWSRAKKVALIEESNPTWDDLSESGYGKADCTGVRSVHAAGIEI